MELVYKYCTVDCVHSMYMLKSACMFLGSQISHSIDFTPPTMSCCHSVHRAVLCGVEFALWDIFENILLIEVHLI